MPITLLKGVYTQLRVQAIVLYYVVLYCVFLRVAYINDEHSILFKISAQ